VFIYNTKHHSFVSSPLGLFDILSLCARGDGGCCCGDDGDGDDGERFLLRYDSSARHHLSWFSSVSFFHASAIA